MPPLATIAGMSRPAARAACALVVLLLLAACSGGDDGDDVSGAELGPASEAAEDTAVEDPTGELETIPLPGATSTPSAVAPPEERPSPPHREVEIISPADQATVSSPVTLEVRVVGFVLTPIDGSFEDDSGHLYAYVDRPLPTAQERIPEDPSIVRFAATTVELPELEPGEHTIRVIASHGYPVPMMPIVSDEVTVTVR